MNDKMEIDLVYCYVNGNDEEWKKKRQSYAADEETTVCRFRDNSELKYSLRSVEKNAPWIHRIFIVVDSESQIPDWLDTSNPKIKIIFHRDIIPEQYLPCFNSNVIESYLYRIPGLAEVFLYANDDVFFGNRVVKDFFVSGEKPLVRLVESKKVPENYYERVVVNAQQIIRKKYGVMLNLIPTHAVDIYSKSAMENCSREFEDAFAERSKNRFREENDINRVIFSYYMILHELCELKAYRKKSLWDKVKMSIFPAKYLDYAVCNLNELSGSARKRYIFRCGPKLACLNDNEKTTQEDLIRYHRYMRKKFPTKSGFEKR